MKKKKNFINSIFYQIDKFFDEIGKGIKDTFSSENELKRKDVQRHEKRVAREGAFQK